MIKFILLRGNGYDKIAAEFIKSVTLSLSAMTCDKHPNRESSYLIGAMPDGDGYKMMVDLQEECCPEFHKRVVEELTKLWNIFKDNRYVFITK